MIGNLHQHLPPSNVSTQSIDGGSGNQVTNTIDNNIINSIIVCAANNISGIAEDLAELNTKTPEIMKIHYDAAVEELESAFVNSDYSREREKQMVLQAAARTQAKNIILSSGTDGTIDLSELQFSTLPPMDKGGFNSEVQR